MTTVFIAGSINIKHLDVKVKDRIGNIVTLGFQVLVGDAEGRTPPSSSSYWPSGTNTPPSTAAAGRPQQRGRLACAYRHDEACTGNQGVFHRQGSRDGCGR